MSKPIGRPKKDEDWIHVTKEENGKWKCKYCKHEFSGGTAPCSFDRGNEGDLINMASGSTNPQQHVNDTLGSIQVAEGVPVPERIDAIASSSIHHQNNIECGDMEEEVFKVLKRSYDNLVEKNLQNSFLYYALFPDSTRHELILKLLDIGLFEGRKSLEEIFNEGNNILDKLISHSLLQEDKDLNFFVSPFLTVMDVAPEKFGEGSLVQFQ